MTFEARSLLILLALIAINFAALIGICWYFSRDPGDKS